MARNVCSESQSEQSRQECIARGDFGGGALQSDSEAYAFIEDVEFVDVNVATKDVVISVVRQGSPAYRKTLTWSRDNRAIWSGCPCVLDTENGLPVKGSHGSLYLHASIRADGGLTQRPKYPHDFPDEPPYSGLRVVPEQIVLKGFFYDGADAASVKPVGRAIEVDLLDQKSVEKKQELVSTGRSTLVHLTSKFLEKLDPPVALNRPLRIFPTNILFTGRYVADGRNHGSGTVDLLDWMLARRAQEIKIRQKEISLALSPDGRIEFGDTGSLERLRKAVESINRFKLQPPGPSEEHRELALAHKLVLLWREQNAAADDIMKLI
jgi:hypothetical protein